MIRTAAVALALLIVAGCAQPGAPATVRQTEMEDFVQAHGASGKFMGAVLVARGGEVLHSAGYGMANLEHASPNTPETVFRLASLSKAFTAAAVLQLQEQGRLDVNDTLDRYLPSYPHGGEITLHQLLNHTSGTPDYAAFTGHSTAFRNRVSLDELIATFSGLPLEFPPGSQFAYSNSGYALLAAVIQKVSGQRHMDYLAEHIFGPLGMAATGYDEASAVMPGRAAGYAWEGGAYRNAEFIDLSNAAGSGDLATTVLDLHKWDRALYTDQVLGAAARAAYFAPSAVMGEGAGYAYGWAEVAMGGRAYQLHGGGINGFNTFVARYPAEELYVAVLSNVESAATQHIAMGLAAIALGDPYDLPGQPEAVEVDPAIYASYAGRYQVSAEMIITVTTDSGRLFAQVPDQPQIELLPASETEFFAEGADLRLRFEVGEDGAVTGMIILEGGQEIHAAKVAQR
jgi:CubicO group peptidase (beta-lactamase class C family)